MRALGVRPGCVRRCAARAVIGSMQHHAGGVTTMRLAYTGTQQDAAAARAKARAHSRAAGGAPPPSMIRDHTGSGVEHVPVEPPAAPAAGKVRPGAAERARCCPVCACAWRS